VQWYPTRSLQSVTRDQRGVCQTCSVWKRETPQGPVSIYHVHSSFCFMFLSSPGFKMKAHYVYDAV
jgi:hypothetical protein